MGKVARKKRQARVITPVSAPKLKPTAVSIYEPLSGKDFLLCAIVGLAALLVFLRTLCPTIYTSGAGENVTAAATLGVPHPPGFPLFCILAKLSTVLIPAGSIAFRVNLFSAMCGAAAAALLFLIVRSVHGAAARAAGAGCALILAFSRTFWSQAVIAEVYTLNALLLLLILYSLLRWNMGGSLIPAGLFAGLGLAVHPLQILFFPGWLFFVWNSERRKQLTQNDLYRTLLLLLIGLGLHLYTPIRSRANPVLDWGNPENFRNLIAYWTASQYRGRMFTLPFQEVASNLVEGLRLLTQEFLPWLLPLPAAGAWFLFRRKRQLFFATALPAVLTVIYAVNYDIPWEIDVYYIPVVLVLSSWSAWALSEIGTRLRSFSLVLPLLAFLPLLHNYRVNDRSQHRIALAYGHDILSSSPQGATLILPETDATFTILYLTVVEKQRNDLSIWVEATGGLKTFREAVNPEFRPMQPLQVIAQAKGPVFYTHPLGPDSIPGYIDTPHGVLYRISRKQAVPAGPTPDFRLYELERFVHALPDFYLDDRSRVILANYLLSKGDQELADGNPAAASKHYETAQKLAGDIAEIGGQLGLRYADLGNTDAAISQLSDSLAQTEDAVVYNRLGRLLVQAKRYEEAKTAFQNAIRTDPNFAMAHSNLGALYGQQGDLQSALKELETAVRLDETNALAHNNLGRVYLLSGKPDRAIAEFRTSLTLDPAQPEIREQLLSLDQTP